MSCPPEITAALTIQMLIAELLLLCHSSTRRYSHRNADFTGEFGNAHSSFANMTSMLMMIAMFV
jgi:hypothetical protein